MRIAAMLLVSLAACSGEPPAVNEPARPPPTPVAQAEPLDAAMVQAIRLAASGYRQWGRVDERPNIAPMKCDMPRRGDFGVHSHVRQSAAEDSPHDKKLYYLWASEAHDYLALAHDSERGVANGFTIVKESFAAVPRRTPAPGEPAVAAPDLRDARLFASGHVPPPVTWLEIADGTQLEIGDATGVYVMTKLGGATLPGTDAGWIYGTVAPDGTVTSAGRVATCMGCHEDAGEGRLFGLQPTKELVPPPVPPGHPF